MKYVLMVMLMIVSLSSNAKESESYYVTQWCQGKGIEEFILPDRTRVDCLTDEYAIEFDFGRKWAEAIGQSLYYGYMTDRRPAVVLILERDEQRFVDRFKITTQDLDILLIEHYLD